MTRNYEKDRLLTSTVRFDCKESKKEVCAATALLGLLDWYDYEFRTGEEKSQDIVFLALETCKEQFNTAPRIKHDTPLHEAARTILEWLAKNKKIDNYKEERYVKPEVSVNLFIDDVFKPDG